MCAIILLLYVCHDTEVFISRLIEFIQMIINRYDFDTKGTARAFQIRSDDKTVHVVPDTSQGAELSRVRVESSASRETAESSTFDQLSVKTYPTSR